MINNILSKLTIFTLLALLTLNSCANRGDARKTSPNPDERVQDNIEQGKGITLKETFGIGKTNFEFASSNELWRASLDTIDFMPLTSANYSGGIIITDWYSENENTSESIKLVIRFLTNEIRSDAIDLKIFYKNCRSTNNCKVSEKVNELNTEITKEILKRAARYKEEAKDKKK